jgi:hypothetical protein
MKAGYWIFVVGLKSVVALSIALIPFALTKLRPHASAIATTIYGRRNPPREGTTAAPGKPITCCCDCFGKASLRH